MRMSCNGCRVLRKGCSENCSIRPCLQWIKNPESQANATVFLAKFYGRAGLMNLINAGPDHLRPAIFRSLLYEACGRIVNPIYGSVGLLWSGSWQLCQAAVEAVLKGAPIVQISTEAAANQGPAIAPLSSKPYDIRHVSKEENTNTNSAACADLHKVKSRSRFKRSASKPKPKLEAEPVPEPTDNELAQVCNLRWRRCYPGGFNGVDSDSSSQSEPTAEGDDSAFSAETVEVSLARRADSETDPHSRVEEIGLELTLGFEPAPRTRVERHHSSEPVSDVTLGL